MSIARGETMDYWVRVRVAHMVTCPRTQVLLLDEIMSTEGASRTQMMNALGVVSDHPPKSPEHDLACTTVAQLIVHCATEKAQDEWDHLA